MKEFGLPYATDLTEKAKKMKYTHVFIITGHQLKHQLVNGMFWSDRTIVKCIS
jgi:hypothetical protein